MYHHAHTWITRRAAWLACIVMLALPVHGRLGAQGWMNTYGSGTATGAAAVESSTGDIIAVGSDGDAVTMSTNASGAVILPTFYPFLGYTGSAATDVKEYPNGDWIVVGIAYSASGTTEAFAMRTSSFGAPIWIRTLS